MISGDGRKRRQLTPEEKWQLFLDVTSQQLTQADAARKYGVDVSVVIRLRRLAKDGALAAFVASKPGRRRRSRGVGLVGEGSCVMQGMLQACVVKSLMRSMRRGLRRCWW